MHDLEIAYWTWGELSARRDNALLLLHNASGTRASMKAFCGEGRAFDPSRYFLIALDVPGGGGSDRASTRADFPATYTVSDCANAAASVLERLELRARSVCGPSMASMIGLQLAALRPDLVGALVIWAGGCRSDGFARATAEALAAMLRADDSSAGWSAAARSFFCAVAGKGMLARMSEVDIDAGAQGLANEWRRHWRADELASRYLSIAACDLLALHGGQAAFAAKIKRPSLWLQAEDDAVFPVAQAQALHRDLARATLKTIDTPLGHLITTAAPGAPEQVFLKSETRAFLETLAP